MHDLTVEHQRVSSGASLAKDLARKLADGMHRGKAVVVTDKPLALLSVVRKQWLKIEYKLWIERARTINAARIAKLNSRLAYMQRVSFTARPPRDPLEADVTFATADDLLRVAPDCKMMFVTYDFPKIKLHMITSWMPRNGIVVIYDQR